MTARLSPPRAAALMALLAFAVYANALANGFAYDDPLLIQLNDAVRGADWARLAGGPYWPDRSDGVGLYRPLTMLSYGLDWKLWAGAPFGFHLVNVGLHAAVTVLVFSLLLPFTGLTGAAAGAALFAIHPVHVEAVANVVGRAELLAALWYLAACLVYLRAPEPRRRAARSLRLLAVSILYFLALASKEIAVTLPAALLLLEATARRAPERPALLRLYDELPIYVLLLVAFAVHLGLRYVALGGLAGDLPHPALRGLSGGERLLTALTVWPEYVRLLVFPFDLSSDYSPAVLGPARSVTPAVTAGLLVVFGLVAIAVATGRRAPPVSLGIVWFAVTILPVSNLLVPVGVLLAERTLYLPSVGVAFAAAALVPRAATLPAGARRMASALAAAAAVALLARTVTRNPVWRDTDTMYETLIEEHPESYRALWALAGNLEVRGRPDLAWRAFQEALALAPRDYGLLVDAGRFLGHQKRWDEAERLLRHAIDLHSELPAAYRILALQLVRRGQPHRGLAVALGGIPRVQRAGKLWGAVAEAYAAAGDPRAAVRAQRAALAYEPGAAAEWLRLAEYLEADGDFHGAREARARARELASNS